MLKEDIAKHILEIKLKNKLSAKTFATLIGREVRTIQLKFKSGKWTLEDVELIEKKFDEKILYSAKEFFAEKNTEAIIQIKLKNKHKEAFLKQIIGKKDLELINK